MKSVYFTLSGLNTLKAEQESLRKKRIEAVAELKRARDMGDLSENAAYKVARFKLSGIDRRILQISLLMRNAKVVEKPSDGTIGIGSEVRVRQDSEEKEYEIVGAYESDPQQGKISHLSPLGKALLYKKAGDSVIFVTPSGQKEIQIKAVA